MQPVPSFEESDRSFGTCPLHKHHAEVFHEKASVQVSRRRDHKPPVGHHPLSVIGEFHDELDVVVEACRGEYRNRRWFDLEPAGSSFINPKGSLRPSWLESLNRPKRIQKVSMVYPGDRVNLKDMLRIACLIGREWAPLFLHLDCRVLRPKPPDAGDLQGCAGTFGAMYDVHRLFLESGVRDLSDGG